MARPSATNNERRGELLTLVELAEDEVGGLVVDCDVGEAEDDVDVVVEVG